MIFINCATTESLGLFKRFFPISIPYSIAYLMAMLKKNNLKFHYIDQQINDNVYQLIDEFSKCYDKKIFCLSFLSESLNNALKISKYIKLKYPNSTIIWGGIHVTAMPEDCLSYGFADYIFLGEAESVINEIYYKAHSDLKLYDIKGIGYKENDKIILNEKAAVIKNLDEIPIIPYDIFNSKKYSLGYFTTSRGCPYNCSFCNNNLTGNKKVRYKSIDRVAAELEILIEKHKQIDITFYDDNFLTNKNRIFEICEIIQKYNWHKKCNFMFQSRAKDIDKETVQVLSKSGFRTAFLGIESVSENILKLIGKNEKIEQITNAIKILKNENIKVMSNFIFGFPFESREDRHKCLKYSILNEIDIVKFNNVVPYPGTNLYSNYKNKLNLNSNFFDNFNSQLTLIKPFYKKITFPLLPQNTSNNELEIEILFYYFKFYFRISRLKKILSEKKWGNILFQYGDKKINILKNTPSLIILIFNLTLKLILAVFKYIYILLSRKIKAHLKKF